MTLWGVHRKNGWTKFEDDISSISDVFELKDKKPMIISIHGLSHILFQDSLPCKTLYKRKTQKPLKMTHIF